MALLSKMRNTFLATLSLLVAVAGQELTFPNEHQASSGWYTMNIGSMSMTNAGTYGITTRGFTNGVTFRMNPGDSLRVKVVNDMLASNNKACTETAGEFCESTITNLHTHGLHVSSKGVSDGLAYDSDNIFADIAPGGNEKQFEFTIPDYHMGGTHWYHPHHHHATTLQAGGGAAGVIIVDDPTGYLPTEYSSMPEKILFISGHNLQTLQTIAQSAEVTGWLEDAVATATAAGLDANVFLVNGQVGPTMTMSSHSWYRFRTVYAAVEQTLHLSVQGDAVCTLKLLAKDGVYLPEIPRDINSIRLYPGSRADVAVSCTCATYPCSGTLSSTARRRLQASEKRANVGQRANMGRRAQGKTPPGAAGMDAVDVDVLTLTVQETAGGSVATLPTTTLERPCYLADLRSASVPQANIGTLDLNGGARAVRWNGVGNSMTYANIHANGGTKNTWPAITSFTVGSVYEMGVTGANAHPLHLHVNPYQIINMNGQTSLSDGYFQAGDWHDTLHLEDIAQGVLTVRMNTDKFTGKMVVHCHILEHEDEGMMAWIDLTGNEGATYAEAPTLQPGCYTSAFASGPTLAPTAAPPTLSPTAAPTLGPGETAAPTSAPTLAPGQTAAPTAVPGTQEGAASASPRTATPPVWMAAGASAAASALWQ